MGCPGNDGKGNRVEMPAKTKEMIYRTQMPNFQGSIIKDKEEKNVTGKWVSKEMGGGRGK